MWPWNLQDYPCPVCGAKTWYRSDRIEGTVCESESECRSCHEWRSESSYGSYTEQIGFVAVEWYYTENSPHTAIIEAIDEMRSVIRHPDYEAMKRAAPEYVLADWFGDHGFPIQEAALRGLIASSNRSAES